MDFIKSIFSKKTPEGLQELQDAQKALREEFFAKTNRSEKEKGEFHQKDGELCVKINQLMS